MCTIECHTEVTQGIKGTVLKMSARQSSTGLGEREGGGERVNRQPARLRDNQKQRQTQQQKKKNQIRLHQILQQGRYLHTETIDGLTILAKASIC